MIKENSCRLIPPDALESVRSEVISSGLVAPGIERHLVAQFVELHERGHFEDRIRMSEADTLVCEQSFKFGRADIVVYHADGSASVIEAKDGTRGYTHVVSGIGQATLYAVQLAASKGAVQKVRRCLLWTSTGNLTLDCLIETACEQAGVISLPMPSMHMLQATREAVTRLVQEAKHGCP